MLVKFLYFILPNSPITFDHMFKFDHLKFILPRLKISLGNMFFEQLSWEFKLLKNKSKLSVAIYHITCHKRNLHMIVFSKINIKS